MPIPMRQRVERYDQWRNQLPVSRPMIGLAWEPHVPALPEMIDSVGQGHQVMPNEIRPELFLAYIEEWYQEDRQLQSDVIQSFAPAFGIPWVEAMAGCPVVAHPGSLWAQPFLSSYTNRKRICFDANNPWLQKLMESTHALVRQADGRFPVSLPLMRGPLDTLAALRTPQQMCLDMVDQPEEVIKILQELTDLWIGIAETVLAIIPPFHGGYCTRLNMWAPGKALTPQNDISSIVSRALYEKFALPCDRRIVRSVPFHSFHLHSTEHHQALLLLGLNELTALQLFLEPDSGGPPMSTMIPIVRRILDRKPLLLGVPRIEIAEQCLSELPATGLCLMLSSEESVIPREFKLWLEQRCHQPCERSS